MIQQFLKNYIRRSPRSVEKRVVWLVKHAWENVSFYRDLMEENGISPSDIQSLKDFVERFPRTSASEYRTLQQAKGAVLQNRIEYTIDYVGEMPIALNGKTKTLISCVAR